MHKGSCHCGQTRYTVDAGEIPAMMECNCSHCQRKGYLLWFVPRDALKFESGEDALSTYTFNRHAIRHHFCPTCGIAPFSEGADPRSGAEMAAVNLRCVPDVDPSALKVTPVDGASF